MATSASIENPATVTTKRILSLDVLRGITIAFMILVNNGGEYAYWPLKHSDWNGWTPTDLVFPTFLFVVGTSIVFSTDARLARGAAKASLALHSLRRAIILFLLGLVVNGFPFFHLSTLRIYGVLQRIAICFLIGSLLYLWDRRATSKITLLLICLVGYWVLMRFVPVPGFGVPGRDIPLLDKDANLVAWLDRHIFPARRLYEQVRDPEGLLSDIPALGTTLLGMLTGMWLKTQNSVSRKCAGLLGGGVALIVLGELWNPWFPINKKLWTSSYVLFAAGVSLVCFAICYWAIEMRGWRKGWTYFWLVFGTNAITAYVVSELLAPGLYNIALAPRLSAGSEIYSGFQHIHPPPIGALAYALAYVLVCWLIVWPLYVKRIFIKV